MPCACSNGKSTGNSTARWAWARSDWTRRVWTDAGSRLHRPDLRGDHRDVGGARRRRNRCGRRHGNVAGDRWGPGATPDRRRGDDGAALRGDRWLGLAGPRPRVGLLGAFDVGGRRSLRRAVVPRCAQRCAGRRFACEAGRGGERARRLGSPRRNNGYSKGSPVSERTLVLIKPDGVQRGLVGEVLARIERKGFSLVALEMRVLEREVAEEHYGEHKDKPFFSDLVAFITGGPLVAAVIEGPEAIASWRAMMGATNPANAAPGTIRGDLATETQMNVTHGSESTESAAREIALFFPGLG